MKKIELNEMVELEGGLSNENTCGVGVGLYVGGLIIIGAATGGAALLAGAALGVAGSFGAGFGCVGWAFE